MKLLFDDSNFHEIFKITICKSNFIILLACIKNPSNSKTCLKTKIFMHYRFCSKFGIKYWQYYFNILLSWNAHSSSFNRLFLRLAFCHKLWLVPSHKKVLALLDPDRVWVSLGYVFRDKPEFYNICKFFLKLLHFQFIQCNSFEGVPGT